MLAASIFFVSLVLGTLIGRNTIEELMNQLGGLLTPLAPTGNLSILLFFLIFINNAIKALMLVVLGVLLGIPTILSIGLNGFIVGGLGSLLAADNGWVYAVAGLAPHGVIEIPVMLLAAVLGLAIGVESFKWLSRTESHVKLRLLDSLKVYLRWVLPGLAAAAIIEVLVTPRLIGLANGG